jgi:peptidoglycan hydrolase-like protein with peptidoglycan-binding domain
MKGKPTLPAFNAARCAILLTAMISLTVTACAQAQAPAASTATTKKTIRSAQERLQALGYQPGSADGVIGARMIAALKKFQSDRGLSATGVLDGKTVDALNAPSEAAATKPTTMRTYTTPESAEKYHILTPDSSFSCDFVQDLSASVDPNNLRGNVNATGERFECEGEHGKEVSVKRTVSIELESLKRVDGKVMIKTREFGTILMPVRGVYEMTESQITRLKTLLDAKGKVDFARIAGDIQAANLIHRVEPTYSLAKFVDTQSTIKLALIINRNGWVDSVSSLSGNALLSDDAAAAVRHWVYKPTLIDGEAVVVLTTVELNFVPGSR